MLMKILSAAEFKIICEMVLPKYIKNHEKNVVFQLATNVSQGVSGHFQTFGIFYQDKSKKNLFLSESHASMDCIKRVAEYVENKNVTESTEEEFYCESAFEDAIFIGTNKFNVSIGEIKENPPKKMFGVKLVPQYDKFAPFRIIFPKLEDAHAAANLLGLGKVNVLFTRGKESFWFASGVQILVLNSGVLGQPGSIDVRVDDLMQLGKFQVT